jgi:hypothetical protein
MEILGELRIERRALMRDYVGCAFNLRETKTALAILKAMDSLDDAANDLEINVSNRTWNMEKGLNYCRTHPAN